MSEFRIGTVLRDAAGVVRRAPSVFAALVALAVAPSLLGRLLDGRDGGALVISGSLLNLYLQLFATARALDLLGAMPADYRRRAATEGRYPSAFAASFVSSLAIGAGLLLFVVPGLLLLALWGVWMPALLAERLDVVAALRRSWRLARPWLGRMLLLVLVTTGLFAAAVGLPLLLVPIGHGLDLLAESLVGCFVIASPILWACVFHRLRLAAPLAPPTIV